MIGDLYETILRIPESVLSIPKQAIIVPAFEVCFDSTKLSFMNETAETPQPLPSECYDLDMCWSKYRFLIPHHKDELMSCLQYGPCKQFKEKVLTHVAANSIAHL